VSRRLVEWNERLLTCLHAGHVVRLNTRGQNRCSTCQGEKVPAALRGVPKTSEHRTALSAARQKQWSLARVDMRITRLGCWEPQNVRSKRNLARKLWVKRHGPIPTGTQLNHRCDNERCVRPDHLYTGTAKDNRQDQEARRLGRPDRRAFPIPDDWQEAA